MRSKEVSRLILDMKKHGIDAFDEFGRYNYVNTQTKLPTHTHPDMIEICYLAKGTQEYFIDNKTFLLYGGDLFITFPDEIHGTGDAPERKFKGNMECERLLKKIIHLYFSSRDTLTKMELNNLLVSFLLHVIRTGENTYTRSYSKRITKTINYIEDNLFEAIDLENLAGKCNLSLSRFKHLFKEETGIPPAEYIIRKKSERARMLLQEQGFSIKDIAYDLGFSSPAYFSTVFRQYNGHSSTEYQKKCYLR